MKYPSQASRALIQELYKSSGIWDRFLSNFDPPLAAFDKIGDLGEAFAVPHLTPFLLDRRRAVREACARTMGRIIANTKPSEFVQLDEAFRSRYSNEVIAYAEWLRLNPKDVASFRELPEWGVIMGIASFHRNGFVRHAAVNELATCMDGSEIPFLLIRLNDWIAPIRESAASAIAKRLRQQNGIRFLLYLRLVYRLRDCGRGRHEQFVSDVVALLQEPDSLPLLRQGIASHDRWLRRESSHLVIASKIAGAALFQEMLSNSDPVVRLWTVREIIAGLSDLNLEAFVPKLAKDRWFPVRCETLNLLGKRKMPGAESILLDTLLDSHHSVRSVSRYWLQILKSDFDPVTFYRQVIHNHQSDLKSAAILGLGETGNPADAELVSQFLQSQSVKVRRASIRALSVLDADKYLDKLVIALTDDSIGVSNEATRALLTRTAGIIPELHSRFVLESKPRVRMNLFRLLIKQPLWPRGIFLFEALRDADEKIVEASKSAFHHWLLQTRRVAYPPKESELLLLLDSLKASAGMLTRAEIREMEFLLRTQN